MKISICRDYDPTKTKEHNNKRVDHGWELREVVWTEETLIDLTTKHGISGNEYSDGHRRVESWAGTHAIMLDFDDGGMTKDRLLELQQSWDFDSYVFSSQNHQRKKIKQGKVEPPCDRLRVLIPLAEPIRSEYDRAAVEKWFVNFFEGGDMEDAR